jgi:DNA-binding response OmpR family regulator
MDTAAADQIGKERILLVDDDVRLLEAIEMALVARGKDVEACSTFEAGRRALRNGRFDALITDVRLGAFNGLQLAVIARDEQPHIRIIVFSGFEDPVLRSEAAALGADYLVKPVTGAELCTVLDKDRKEANS